MKKTLNVKKMTQTAVLLAIIFLLAFTPLGYLKTAGAEITFVMIPVIIGAILLGKPAGTLLGFAFGLTSFIQCFGLSKFGTTLFGINPLYTFIVCIVPRTLMGYFTAVIFSWLYEKKPGSTLAYNVASISGALMNTVMFTGTLLLLFRNSDYISQMIGKMNVIAFAIIFVGLQGLIEAVACFIIATAIAKVLSHYIKPEIKNNAE